jgi:hypothetical protein
MQRADRVAEEVGVVVSEAVAAVRALEAEVIRNLHSVEAIQGLQQLYGVPVVVEA